MLPNSNKQQHHFNCDLHHNRRKNFAVLQKYGFKVCVILFDIYPTHSKVYIHLTCIITRKKKLPFDITLVLSFSDCRTPIQYQGSDDNCKGDHNSDVICILHSYLKIHYCNKSMLGIEPDLNILF